MENLNGHFIDKAITCESNQHKSIMKITITRGPNYNDDADDYYHHYFITVNQNHNPMI